MEIANNRSTELAPKLGPVSTRSISSDAFSAHLQQTTSRARADSRSNDRNIKADERSNASAQAEAAKDRRDAQTREADAKARVRAQDRDRDRDRNEDQSSDGSSTVDNTTAELPSTTAPIENIALNDGKLALSSENSESNPDAEFSNELTAATTQDATAENTDPTAGASELKENASANITDSSADLEAGAPALATNNKAGAETKTDAAFEKNASTNETADRPTAASIAMSEADHVSPEETIAGSVTNPAQTNQGTEGKAADANSATTEDNGLQNPLAGSAEGENNTDAKSDGEKGLGQQAAEAMAKNKQDTNQANNKTPSMNAQAHATITPPVPTQAQVTTSLGLNATALPTNIDLDLLGNNGNGQIVSGSALQNATATSVRFGALPGQTQATQVPNTAIALQIAKFVSKGVSTFQIRVDPPEMGRIDVKLEMAKNGHVTAHLTVEKPETLDLLQRDAKALEQALRDAGLNANNDTLNFSLNDGTSNNQFNANRQENADSHADNNDPSLATQDDPLITTLAARQINAAARGGIDVSI